MDDCKCCIHQKVCELWRKQECQDAGCFFDDDCELFESVKPLTAQERVELQFYRISELTPWQVRAMRDTIREQKEVLAGYEKDRVNADIKCTDTIAYLNDELFHELDYAAYSNLFERISGITDWENEAYGGSNKITMKEPELKRTQGRSQELPCADDGRAK